MIQPGFIQNIRHRIEDKHHWLTRQKLAVLGATLIVIGIAMGAFQSGQPPTDRTPFTELVALSLPEHPPSPTMEAGREDVNLMEHSSKAGGAWGKGKWDTAVVRPGQHQTGDRQRVRRVERALAERAPKPDDPLDSIALRDDR